MGTCFGCCTKKNMKKPTFKRKFLLNGGSQELPQDEEEFLELEQRAARTSETANTCNEGTCEITKPTKLTFKKPSFGWLRNENQVLSSTLQHFKNMKSPADSVMPLLNRENSFAETCSTGSQKWDQLSLGATPGSSVDLEWENEIGFNSTSNVGATEELQWMVLTENTNNSWRSSPLSNSNGLEWDGDFTSVDVSEIVAETQRLTADIEDNIGLDTTNIDIENNN